MRKRPPIESEAPQPRRLAEDISTTMRDFTKLRIAAQQDNLETFEGVIGGASKEELDKMETILKNEELSLGEKQNLLRSKIREYQQKALELIPEYPIKRKVAVIINGDTDEERHTGNVERAMKTLSARGFDEFYIIGGKNIPAKKGVFQFDVNAGGMKAMFTELGKNLPKDSLVFVYGTGHGAEDKGGSMVIGNDQVGKEELVKYFQVIKENHSKGVFVFDSCFSGAFPEAIIGSGVEGIALSPGVEGKETQCQFFAPSLFEGMIENRDMNKDGKTNMREIFFTALQFYNEKTAGTQTFGEYRENVPELDMEKFETLLQQDKPVLIEISATWCEPCKQVLGEVTNAMAFLNGSVDFYKITDNDPGAESQSSRPEAKAIYERIGVDKPAFPSFYIYQKGKGFRKLPLDGSSNVEEILSGIEGGAGIAMDYSYFVDRAMKEGKITKDQYDELSQRFSIKEILDLVNSKLFSQLTNSLIKAYLSYDRRFNAQDVDFLVFKNITNNVAVSYDKRFGGFEIISLYQNGISAEGASKYDERFGAYDIVDLHKEGLSNEEAIKYDVRFRGDEIVDLHKEGLSNEEAIKYDKRFGGHGIVDLHKVGISGEEASKHDRRFSGDDIICLHGAGIGNEEASKYDKRFRSGDIVYLHKEGISGEAASKYDKRFGGSDIVTLHKEREEISSEEALKYDRRFSIYNIIQLRKAGISGEEASKYGKRFSFWDIIHLREAGISGEEASKYDKRFYEDEIVVFYKNRWSSDAVNGYDPSFTAENIVEFLRNGISNQKAMDRQNK